MTEKVVSLDGGPIQGFERPPNDTTVQVLAEALEQAKLGHLRGIAMVSMRHDRQCPYMIVGEVGGFTMAGSLAAMVHEINVLNTSETEYDE